MNQLKSIDRFYMGKTLVDYLIESMGDRADEEIWKVTQKILWKHPFRGILSEICEGVIDAQRKRL